MSITIEQARVRNIKIKITRALLDDSRLSVERKYEDEELKNSFYFKQSDIELLKLLIFDSEGFIQDNCRREIERLIELHRKILEEVDYITECENLKFGYLELKKHYDTFNIDAVFIEEILNQLSETVIKLHYYLLPIYDEQFIYNSEIIPEDNLKEFYHHFHAIEDLYRFIFEPKKSIYWKSTGGDLNLGYKLSFKIYTSRWGHYDNYTFIRTYRGWKISALANTIECDRNGEALYKRETIESYSTPTGLYYSLHHDSVQFPEEGVKYALEELWKEADSREMGIEELQTKLSDIANWISQVEKATHKYQPIWCKYY